MTTKIYYRDSSKDMYEDVPDKTKPKFDVVTLTTYKTETGSSMELTTGSALVFVTIDTQVMWAEVLIESGTGTPTNIWTTYYNTNDNKVYRYTTDKTTPTYQGTFPIAKISFSDGTITSIDQVFNGFGYIGNCGFVLPDVEVLIPNGRNSDGSLNNIKYKTQKVYARQIQYGANTLYFWLNMNNSGDSFFSNEFFIQENMPTYNSRAEWYKPSDNKIYFKRGGSSTWTQYMGIPVFSNYGNDNGVTSFTPKTVFHAVDYNDFSDLDSNVVHKTGDEIITGLKTFQDNIVIKKTTSDFSVAPQNPLYTEIRNVDVNGYEIGQFRVWKDTDGANVIDLLGRYQHGTANVYGATLGIKSYADGASYGYCFQNRPRVPGALVTLTSQNYSSNGYVQYSNGLIIQWGSLSISTTTKATWNLTFPRAFSNTNYQITFGVNNQGKYLEKMPAITGKTKTGINGQTIYTGGTTNFSTCIAMWIAIGY